MGFFNDLWDFIKSAAKKIGEFISKVFYTIYSGIKYTVECIHEILTKINNSWVGTIADALPFIFELLNFLKKSGADVDVTCYKENFKDMDLDKYGNHKCSIEL